MLTGFFVIAFLVGFAFWQGHFGKSDEERLQEQIERTEEAFLAFGVNMRPRIETLENAHLREQLPLPFVVVEMNRDNPYKNRQTLAKIDPNEIDERGRFRQENANFFSYESLDRGEEYGVISVGAAASFSPPHRLMFIGFEQNTLDLLVTYHEVFHTIQDVAERSRLQTQEDLERYIDFYRLDATARPRVLLSWETTAFAYELEMLDLYLDGELRASIAEGRPLSAEIIAARLDASPDQLGTVRLLHSFALSYFPEGVIERRLPARFVREVGNFYYEAGHRLYATEGGVLDAREIFPGEF